MIRLTFVSDGVRGVPQDYDTDDLAEALAQDAARGFRLHRDRAYPENNRGPDKWVVAFVVERDEHRYDPDELVGEFKRIASLEGLRRSRRAA